MKKTLLLLIIFLSIRSVHAQSTVSSKTTLSAKEQAMNDSLCNCMAKIDISTIKTAQQAEAVFTNCMTSKMSLLIELAEEKHINIEDEAAMHDLGVGIGKNLFKQNCSSFAKLAILMADTKKNENSNMQMAVAGTFKRIDSHDFNYVIISVAGNEKSFLWFRQFPGSENLVGGSAKYVGKKVEINYQEVEAYLPQAKGYYKVKEITELHFEN